MNKQTATRMSMLGLMGAVATLGAFGVRDDRDIVERPFSGSRPERHQRAVHPRRNAHLLGAWRPEARSSASHAAGGG